MFKERRIKGKLIYNPIPNKPWHYFISRYFINKQVEEDKDYINYLDISLQNEIDNL